MKKILEYRAVILLLALIGLAGLSYLAAGLRNIEFHEPEPFGFNFGQRPDGVGLGSVLAIPVEKFIVFGGILALLIVLALLLVDSETRKRLLWILFRYSLTFAALWWVMKNIALKRTAPDGLAGAPAGLAGEGAPGAGPPVYLPPQISPWLIFGISFALAFLFLLIGWVLYLRSQKKKSFASLAEIAGIARATIDGLSEGHSWDEAIVQCYVRMNQAVTAQRGLIRQVHTTPSEFATRMERAGLPGEAARALTRLFEQVRYGGMTPTQDDRNLALAALNAILRACGAMP